MRAVDLTPRDQRRGRGAGTSGRTGVAPFVLLAALAVLVIMATAHTLLAATIDDRRGTLAGVRAQADAAERTATSLNVYTQFAGLREKRVQTVRQLATSRFDWAQTLHELARTMPAASWLTSLRATVSPSTALEGGASDPLRQALALPAIEVIGCTRTHKDVARVISAMRRMNGVARVSLSSSASAENGEVGSADGDCRNGNASFPQFSMAIFYRATAPAPASSAPASAPTP